MRDRFPSIAWKHGSEPQGATIRLHRRFQHASPDAWYESALLRLVGPETRWLDAGCGRSPCPFNPALAAHLAQRCALLAGVDRSPEIHQNPFVHRRFHGDIADMPPDRFDLVTLRMVAEHLADPARAAAALASLVRPGGTLLIYTVDARSPSVLLGSRLGGRAHRWAMRMLFGGQTRDVYDAYYRMNTPALLAATLTGFRPRRMDRLDDCRLSIRWPWLHATELTLWRALRRVGLPYPERCLLAELERDPCPALPSALHRSEDCLPSR